MPQKKSAVRSFNIRQATKYYFSQHLQRHWYPANKKQFTKNFTNKILISHNSKFIDNCINKGTLVFLSICLPIFLLLSIFYRNLLGIKAQVSGGKSGILIKKNIRCKLITIGNIIVGGVGKTPMVLAVADKLKSEGFKVAVITKGYAGKKLKLNETPEIISNNLPDHEAAKYFGDEPVLVSKLTGLPVCVARNRLLAVELLMSKIPELDYIISDDGLQSLNQFSKKKILVLDERFFGNSHCLPYGPMREPWPPPYDIDAIILNLHPGSENKQFNISKLFSCNRIGGVFETKLNFEFWENFEKKRVDNKKLQMLTETGCKNPINKVLAFAGIGVPSKFFETLENLGFAFDVLPLHNHEKNINEILEKTNISDYKLILTTQKDGIKINSKNKELINKLWKLHTKLDLPDNFYKTLIEDDVHGFKTY